MTIHKFGFYNEWMHARHRSVQTNWLISLNHFRVGRYIGFAFQHIMFRDLGRIHQRQKKQYSSDLILLSNKTELDFEIFWSWVSSNSDAVVSTENSLKLACGSGGERMLHASFLSTVSGQWSTVSTHSDLPLSWFCPWHLYTRGQCK